MDVIDLIAVQLDKPISDINNALAGLKFLNKVSEPHPHWQITELGKPYIRLELIVPLKFLISEQLNLMESLSEI